MIRLATAFSGIGAIEHALDRMQLEHTIVFACDNGDVDILSKNIDDNIKEIDEEFKNLKKIVNNIKDEEQFTKQLKSCESKLFKVEDNINNIEIQELKNNLLNILKKTLNEKTKKNKKKEYENLQKIIEELKDDSINSKFEQIKITLRIINDFSKDNKKNIDKDKVKSSDNLNWGTVLGEINLIKDISERSNFKKIQKDVKEVCEYLGMLHERINT